MKTLFVVCQHGNEITPLRVIEKYFKNRIDYLVANKEALEKNKRFIDTDLNRSFLGNKNGSKEEKIAYKLKKVLYEYDQIIDLHTTSVFSPIFIITTSLSLKHQELIDKLDIKRVVYMEKSIAKGNSLIDNVSLGVSVEKGREGSKNSLNSFKKFISEFLENKNPKIKKEYFVVFDILRKINSKEKLEELIKSFKLVKRGMVISRTKNKKRIAIVNFYPIMPGEKSYKGVLTLMARKLSKNEIKQKKFSVVI